MRTTFRERREFDLRCHSLALGITIVLFCVITLPVGATITPTSDRAWYEIVKQHIQSRREQDRWKSVEFFAGTTFEHDLPISKGDKTYIEKAKEYYADNDYKAAVIYLRTHFEQILKDFCDEQRLRVQYKPIVSSQVCLKPFAVSAGPCSERIVQKQIDQV